MHQGVVADIDDAARVQPRGSGARRAGPPLIVVLDGIEDPHNLGAILRTADATGVDGVVVQTRRSAARSGAAAKASAGAVAHVKIAEVVNIARALEELKDLGVWTVGLAGEAPTPYDASTSRCRRRSCWARKARDCVVWCASGAIRWRRFRCSGHVGSVNVSVAAGVVLFEAVRQRRNAGQSAG